ncbi:MAG: carboxypeptidase-like regulatory domain-containing protein [Ferruginibacter sp.]
MKKLICIISLCFISILAFSQAGYFSISGKVIDAASKTPMQAASVFAQNTTIGTVTNADGNFTIWLPNGGYDLIVTYTGYETVSKRVSAADAANTGLSFEMKQKEKSMEEVAIKTSNEVKDGWVKYGDFFIENFIGKTINSKQCSISNKDILHFYFSKKRNRLKVLADEPVVVVNQALGYNIKYTLDSFVYDYTSNTGTFTGYPLFEEIPLTDPAAAVSRQALRMKAYKGSILHFMRSVYDRRIKEEGFDMQLVANNRGEDTVLKVKDYYGALNYVKDDSSKLVEIIPNQPDVAVLYKDEIPEEEYSLLNKEAPTKFQLSVMNIDITRQQTIGIEQNGYYFDQDDINFTGYWAWEKVGDMLPYDFKPD